MVWLEVFQNAKRGMLYMKTKYSWSTSVRVMDHMYPELKKDNEEGKGKRKEGKQALIKWGFKEMEEDRRWIIRDGKTQGGKVTNSWSKFNEQN
jgi:hypothetical protein